MIQDITFRPADEGDYRYCYYLTKKNMLALITKYWGGWKPSVFRKGFVPTNITIVLYKKRRIGYFSIVKESDHIWIDNIQLTPRHQGKGIGTKILRGIIENTPRPIYLQSFTDNPAYNLYKRLGFVVFLQSKQIVKMKYE